jgi:putative ABC transport system permease protein
MTLLSIVVGVAGLVLFNGFIEYSMWGLRESTIRSGLGHIQIATEEKFFVSGSYDPFSFLLPQERGMVDHLKTLPEVRAIVPQMRFTGSMSHEGRTGVVMISASDPDSLSDLYGFRSVVSGRELESSDTNKVLLGKGVAEKLGVKVGGFVTILAATSGGGVNAVDLEVVGICTLGSRDLENIMGYTTLVTAKEMLFVDRSPLLVVVLDKTEQTDEVAAGLRASFSKSGIPCVVKPWSDLADYYKQARDLYENMLAVVQWIILLIVVFAIANTMTMAIMERTREIGTIRAMGTPAVQVVLMFLLEAAIIGLAGGALGVVAGYLASGAINLLGGVYIPPPPGRSSGYYALFRPELRYGLEIFLLSAGVALGSAVYPAYSAIRLKIPECLRYL